jgi:uncharacterized protein
MDPEIHGTTDPPQPTATSPTPPPIDGPTLLPEIAPHGGLRWVFIGSEGLRAGWSVALFCLLVTLIAWPIGAAFRKLQLLGAKGEMSAKATIFGELIGIIAIIGAAWIVALVERRRILDFNLTGPRRLSRFIEGLAAGFAALSLLIGMLDFGGWLRFGPVALRGTQILSYAALWGCAFLLVGCFEEGMMRCFLLFTLTRGLNFWWAAGLVAATCAPLIFGHKGHEVWGVYALALIGLVGCAALFARKTPGAGFWYAAWLTSTFFAFGHVSNNGENWIGIFAAGAVGFVFCVSVRVTGSAWWAIGCHAAWDWGETFFYGTADSGQVGKGHYLTTTPAGAAFWSGGADGPEGSVLVLAVLLLMLLALLVFYGRRKPASLTAPAMSQVAG